MKLKFFFISYSVICAKYNYCFEESKDLPVRYFNGKEWKIMKTRHGNFKMRDYSIYPVTVKQIHTTVKAAPRSIHRTPDPFILVQLDKLMKKMKVIGLEVTQATRQNIRSCGKKKTKTSTTEETTTETTPTEEITIQTTPTEEITTPTEEITTTTDKATSIAKPTSKTTAKTIPLKEKTIKTTTTKRTTINTKPILKTTSKTMNRKKVKFKRVVTLKFKSKKLPRQITNNIKKATTKYNRFSCGNSRLKTTTTKKIGPRFLKTIIEQAWNMPLKNYWRPTYIPSQKSSNLCATKTIRKLFMRKTKKTTQKTTKKTTPKTTTETTPTEEITTPTEEITTPTEEITTPTEEITTPTEEITTETTTMITTTQTPRTITELPATTTKKPAENTGIQADAGALSGNWSNLMIEFLRFVEAKKCEPSCKPETTITDLITTEPTNTEPTITKTTITKPTITKLKITKPGITKPTITKPKITKPRITKPTTMPFPLLLLPESAMSDTEDLMSILMGVKKDDKLNKVDNNVSQSKAQHQGNDILRISSEKHLQNVTTRNIKEDNNTAEFNKQRKYLKHLKAKLYKRKSNKTYHISGTETYSDELEGKNFRAKLDEPKNYETTLVSGTEAYLDKVGKNAKILDGSEIESFFNMLKHKHAIKKKKKSEDNEAQSYLDALNARYSENTDQNDDKDIRNHLNAIKDAHNRKFKDNLRNVSKPMFHSNELHDILAFIAPKRTDSTEMRSLPKYEDNYQIRKERTASNFKLMKNLKALRKKRHQIAKSYKYTTIMNFKYALDDI